MPQEYNNCEPKMRDMLSSAIQGSRELRIISQVTFLYKEDRTLKKLSKTTISINGTGFETYLLGLFAKVIFLKDFYSNNF